MMEAPTIAGYTKRKRFVIRCTISFLMGLAIIAISFHAAWHQLGQNRLLTVKQWGTQHNLKLAEQVLNKYQKEFGTNARSLDDLRKMTNEWTHTDPSDFLRDEWGRPFIFKAQSNRTILMSYGRDGLPGGIGLDFDITNSDQLPAESRPTFRQFLYDLPTGRAIKTSICSGVIVFFVAFFTIRVPEQRRFLGWCNLLIGLIIITLATAYVAAIITVLHLPTGH